MKATKVIAFEKYSETEPPEQNSSESWPSDPPHSPKMRAARLQNHKLNWCQLKDAQKWKKCTRLAILRGVWELINTKGAFPHPTPE